ncbi:helix-turn-helix domain-containing protein [Cryobacterium sp. MDB1-18-2]|nr:helix-turn-helix domain-containing protein [Cryobacterium sp. MDB2-A-1]TFC07553.1 helix-turn-helix domain-containing protein [Cryobacterium sp. MDB2-33-2]TFC13852.1 helix-turn-helix domain-containing protein [Cryobacterium sp. MDB2-A-2]TFC23500.1 helix-turn-helix domain-containing protein [Cryobacterium sp. MDB2-10]TFC24312.1 helix-turn-helix domain-containing protein [Cryobacterium sp. MDB1-18-2]TFC40609.1 helix-turn-helix domain-containing protein [Cryobacterium sp. MDB1-18-1]
MPDSPRTQRKGSGALPMVETRAKYAQLMRQGISNAEACRTLKINRRTGMRWRHGRTVANAQGRAKTYAPISLKSTADDFVTKPLRGRADPDRRCVAGRKKPASDRGRAGQKPVDGQP